MIAAELSIAAVIITCFAIAVVGHGGADEHDGRTEQVLATATSRSQSFGATLIVALVGATWLLLVTGVAVALGYGSAGGSLVRRPVRRRCRWPRPRRCGWWPRSPSRRTPSGAAGRCSAGRSWCCS